MIFAWEIFIIFVNDPTDDVSALVQVMTEQIDKIPLPDQDLHNYMVSSSHNQFKLFLACGIHPWFSVYSIDPETHLAGIT